MGNALFTLANKDKVKGFEFLRDRFLTRPTKPCFIEAEIASLLVCRGLNVEVVKESGIRGKDFDLMATRGNDVVSVEVTSKVEGDLTVKTINNTLHAKRNQVPATRPAVLYMHIPAEWMRRDNAYRILSEAIVEFSLRSKRFNSIVFVWEEVVPHMNGGIPQMIMHACYHNFPRHRFEPLNLFEPMGTEDQQGKVAHSLIHALRKHRDALQNKG